MPSRPDLAALLARVALQDRTAFEQLYKASSAHLLGVAHQLLGSRERAEEVLQEGFIAIWHGAPGYRGSLSTPMTWMINVVRNKAIDALRSGRSERAATVSLDDEEGAQEHAAPHADAQRLLEDSLERLRISACMGTLAAQQRQALALAYYHGMVHTDIAMALGAPLGTAKAWVRRGLDKLKGCLEAVGITGAA